MVSGLLMGFSPPAARPGLRPDAQAGPLLAPDRRRDAVAGLRHALLRASTRRWGWPSPGPASSIPSSGRMLGWLGVALTGSDTSSNVLFGSLQKISAEQLGLSPDAHGRGQQLRRGHGQDDRRPVDRRGLDGHRAGTATRARSCATSSSTAWPWRP
ncbi:MAG: L-lactate permease [Anaerotruncus sp.]|nr:L-lactate permease [Anaerotruncus sp.]